jgi:hypothetical protein
MALPRENRTATHTEEARGEFRQTALRHDYLDHEEFRNVPFGKQCSPLDGLFG